MQNNYLSILVLIMLFTSGINAQIFVDQNATGSNSGSSWSDAYADLSDALAASTPGDQIWVAAGTYKPGGGTPSVDAFFSFPHDLLLYGGFAGTETMLAERDWETNLTILSGDHNGDDNDEDITANRTDNSKHVIWLTDTVTNVSVIDGFTIRNGNTEGADGSGNDRRGGGILTYGNPSIRNCVFTQNYGHYGGGVYPRGTDPIVIENCDFISNTASWGGGGLYINSVAATVTDCSFTGNSATTMRGGGMYSSDCTLTVTDCTFTDNSASESSGGGMHLTNSADNEVIEATLTNCIFTGNGSTFGGALACYQGSLIANLVNCDFSGNTAVNVGGAISNAFGVTTNMTDCVFSENESMGSGGAVYSQNDENTITLTNCDLLSNAAQTGGAISMTGDNEASVGLPLPVLNLEKVTFIANFAVNQGGGLNMSNANGNLSNVLFDTNFATDSDGIGGAISLNTSDTINATINLINSTLVNNGATIGAGISHWKPGTESTSVLTLQNTILHNPLGVNYEIEDGDPVLVSAGGNLSTDGSMVTEFSNTNDLNGEDPLFVDFDDQDYHLQDGSPCIDMGIEAGAPATDIEGLPRVNAPDMGAYENQTVVNVRDLNQRFGQLSIFPNPAKDDLNFNFESVWRGRLEIRLTDNTGKLLLSRSYDKGDQALQQQLDIRQLPQGIYNLSVSNGRLVNTHSFVKE